MVQSSTTENTSSITRRAVLFTCMCLLCCMILYEGIETTCFILFCVFADSSRAQPTRTMEGVLWKEDVVLARRAIEIDASDVIIALVQKLMSHHLGYQ